MPATAVPSAVFQLTVTLDRTAPDTVTTNPDGAPSCAGAEAGATDTIAVPGSAIVTVAGVVSTSTVPMAVEARSSATEIVSCGSVSLSVRVGIVIWACATLRDGFWQR